MKVLLAILFFCVPLCLWGETDLSIVQDRPLVFPSSAAGDSSYTLAVASGAQFTVTGPPNMNYTIDLPATPITLTHASGASLTVNGWTSNPSVTGRTNAQGSQTLFVGATRNALSPSLPSGLFQGKFPVTVRTASLTASILADVNATLIASISLTRISDLRFPTRVQGDPPTTISTSSPSAASFEVRGEPNKQFLLLLPASTQMTTGAGATPQQILNISSITASIATNASIPPSGLQSFSVGGTLGAVDPFQQSGSYQGSLLISVTYQ